MISVVIPNYNRLNRLSRAIESIEKQTCEHKIEIIIVDDCSPRFDEINQYVIEKNKTSRFPISHIRHKTNKFASAARNTGIKSAKGEFVALLDSDDAWQDGYLENQLRLFKSFSKTKSNIIIFGRCKNLVSNEGEWLQPVRGIGEYEDVSEYIFLHKQCCQTSTLFSSKSIFENNLFDESLKALQDPSFAINATHNGVNLVYNSEAIVNRYLDWSESNDHVGKNVDCVFLSFWLDRHRYRMSELGIDAYKLRYFSEGIFKLTLKYIFTPHFFLVLKLALKNRIKSVSGNLYNGKFFKKIRVLCK